MPLDSSSRPYLDLQEVECLGGKDKPVTLEFTQL